MSCHPSLSKSANDAPQNQPIGLADAFSVVSSNVPSPLLRRRLLPAAICRNTSTNCAPDCRKISKYKGMSERQTPCRQQFSMYRQTVGASANQANSDLICVTYM